jgi:hypothetical protein
MKLVAARPNAAQRRLVEIGLKGRSEPLNVCNHNDRDGARDQRKSAFNLGDADKIQPLKASPSMRAFIVAFIVFGLTCGISIFVLGRFGMSDNQSLPPSRAAEITLTVGTLIACAVAASHWLLPQPGW